MMGEGAPLWYSFVLVAVMILGVVVVAEVTVGLIHLIAHLISYTYVDVDVSP